MRATPYAVRALALSLSLTAVGAFGVSGSPASATPVGRAGAGHAVAGGVAAVDPIGGAQLAARGVIVNLSPGVPAPPTMQGASFLVADMDTGQILAAKAPHTRRLPASTLKTLTALTLIPRLDADAKIMVRPEDVNIEGSRLGILAGTAYSARTLFQGLLMSSGNDAAYALARANKSVAVTLGEMNATAASLGALDTLAKDPSGLDKPGQTSSVYDLALIGRAAMKLPAFREYVATRSAAIPGGKAPDGKMKPGFKINTHNRLIYNYDGAIGIKNGYTIAARQTKIGAATRGGRTYIVTEMSSPNGSWRPTAALLDWAFAHGTAVTPIGKLVEPGSVPNASANSAAPKPTRAGTPASPDSRALADASDPTGLSGLKPWVGAAGLLCAAALVGAFAVRSTRRSSSTRRRG